MYIKFSHNYPKLWGQKSAFLLYVELVERERLHKDLLEYDTRTGDLNEPYYKLPKGTLIQLVFLGDKGIPFCTLRRYVGAKYNYYK